MLTKLLGITALHDLIGKYYATPVSLKNTLLQGFMLFQILHYHRLMSRLSVNKSSELQCKPDMQLPAENEGSNCWFAIRVSYSRELALKAILDAENIENFIPMRYEYIMKSGKRVRKLLPAIHNLVLFTLSVNV